MLKKDFLIRQLNEFTQALFQLLLRRKENPEKESLQLISETYRFLNLTSNNLHQLSASEIISIFEKEELYLEKLELTGMLLLEEYSLSGNKEEDNCLFDLAGDIISYVDKNSDTYSIERKKILAMLSK